MEHDENKHAADFNDETEITKELDEQPSIVEEETVQVASTEPIKKRKTNKTGWSAFLGGISGGLISAITVVLLFTNQVIPLNQGQVNTTVDSATEQTNTDNIVTTMATDKGDIATNIDEASAAVVGVINLQKQSIWTSNEEAGSGSGIVYKKEDGKAYIVTNHHVVAGAEEVEIALNDENDERIPAKVLGSDELSDLAILQVDGSKINTVAKLGSSDLVKVGDTVYAIGNPLGMDFANTLTKGIISGINRSISVDTDGDGEPDWITEVLQTDAAINPGNSGGALIDVHGNVIGINSMKIARQEVEGIGFALPIDAASSIMDQLETTGKVTRPFIGISTAALTQVPPQYRDRIILPENVDQGLVVANVEAGSPASKAGLQQFDVITKINDKEVTSILDLRKYMYSETTIGDSVKIEFYRNGKLQTLNLILSERESL